MTWDNSGTLVSSTNKTDRHDIPEMLLKVALNNVNYKNFNDEIVFFLLLNEAWVIFLLLNKTTLFWRKYISLPRDIFVELPSNNFRRIKMSWTF